MKNYFIFGLVLIMSIGLVNALSLDVCSSGCSYSNIQGAISNSSDGDVITVGSGTYVEVGQIVISKNLTIVGAGKDVTIIQPSNDTGASSDSRGWFLVNAGMRFDLSNLTLDGNGFKVYQGIRHKGFGTIDSVKFIDLRYDESTLYQGFGVVAFGTPSMNVNILNSEFSNIGRVGVLYSGSGITGSTYSNNVYTGKGVGNWLDYAVEVNGGNVTIIDSVVTNNLGTATLDDSHSGAIISTSQSNAIITISGSQFYDNANGIALESTSTNALITAHNNLIYNNVRHNIYSTSSLIDASNNWFGTINFLLVNASMSGNVSFTPYFTDATLTVLSNCPTESWSSIANTCTNYQQLISYYDLNSCGTTNNLPLDNNTYQVCGRGDNSVSGGSSGSQAIIVPQSVLPTSNVVADVPSSESNVLVRLWNNFVDWFKGLF